VTTRVTNDTRNRALAIRADELPSTTVMKEEIDLRDVDTRVASLAIAETFGRRASARSIRSRALAVS
jgi:hypothetical protein